MIVGYRLRELRLEKKLTQQMVADMLGVSKVSVCGYEKGTRVPSIEILNKILDIFDISADFLLGREISVVCENSDDEIVHISNDELQIIKELRKNKNFLNNMLKNKKRIFKN